MKIRTFTLEDCDYVVETVQRKDEIEVISLAEFNKLIANLYNVCQYIEVRTLDKYDKGVRFPVNTRILCNVEDFPPELRHKDEKEMRFDLVRDAMMVLGYQIVIVNHKLDGDTIRTTYGFEEGENVHLIKRTCDL